MDGLYAQVGRCTFYIIVCSVLTVLAAFVYCVLEALLKGTLAVVIDMRNRKLIRVARYAEHLQLMTPTRFEHLCKTLFANQGYKVRHVGEQSDGGVDLLVSKDGVRSVVQCKRYSRSPVGRPVLQQLYGTFEDERAKHGFLITTSYFSRPAREFAKGKPITLVDRRRLVLWINQYAGGRIEEPAAEQAVPTDPTGQLVCPDCGTRFTPPFKPEGFAPVYCWDCRKKRRSVA